MQVDELFVTELAVHVFVKLLPDTLNLSFEGLHGVLVILIGLVEVHVHQELPDLSGLQETTIVIVILLEAHAHVGVHFLQLLGKVDVLRLLVVVYVPEV